MIQIFITFGTSWTVPSDWNSSNNSVETIGAGGGGQTASMFYAGSGGGGGAYSKVTNLVLNGGDSIAIGVGEGGLPGAVGGDTWFNGTSISACSVGAQGGGGGSDNSGGLGGTSANGVGETKFSGGNGAAVGGSNPWTGTGVVVLPGRMGREALAARRTTKPSRVPAVGAAMATVLPAAMAIVLPGMVVQAATATAGSAGVPVIPGAEPAMQPQEQVAAAAARSTFLRTTEELVRPALSSTVRMVPAAVAAVAADAILIIPTPPAMAAAAPITAVAVAVADIREPAQPSARAAAVAKGSLSLLIRPQ